ncbi:MAG: hypothetical protein HY646_11725 [Acidobacteria bacterium]|nr:hypothetical protein [Acidobacteriota bacterium]
MDPAGLTILLTELQADCTVAGDAGRKAATLLRQDSPWRLEACAYELARFYNILGKMLDRICEGFENHLEKRGDYHERLIQRLSLDLEGIRPAFIPHDRASHIRELKGFRHVTRHAYDLTLRPDRLAELAGIAEQLAVELPVWCADFGGKVRAQQGW